MTLRSTQIICLSRPSRHLRLVYFKVCTAQTVTLLPGFAVPVCECDTSCRGVKTLPPHASITGLANIGEHSVSGNGGHGIGVGLVGSTWSHTEETILWVDGSQFTCRDRRVRYASSDLLLCIWNSKVSLLPLTLAVELHPRNVVSHTLHLPARQSWFHHGQVGFTAGTGERRRDITLHSLRVGDTQDLRREW